MTRYAIGDIQGCYIQLRELLDKIDFNPGKDTLYLVGDLVNRGPQSLEVLKWVYKHQNSIVSVLGNHDIYLLARFNKLVQPAKDDTLVPVLYDKHINRYVDYLRACPLIYQDNQIILVHAGIYPGMDFNELVQLSHTISIHFKAANYFKFIAKIFGNKPAIWNNDMSHNKKMKFVVNACTRMRLLDTQGLPLNYKYNKVGAAVPKNLIPWFKVIPKTASDKKIIFGHWAALGFMHENNYLAIDTGCVWHGSLTAVNLDDYSITQVTNS